jgi:tripartite ATP-independent transporter DctM subunit
MEVNGMSTRLIALLLRTIGRLRGGLRVAMIVAMAVFSGISGSKSADVAAVGSVMVPVMREAGDDDGDAVGLLAATAVMGETIPPCINMIILGYVAGVSIGGLFIAGLIPALLIGIALTVVAVATAPQRPAPTDLTAPEIADTVAAPQVGETVADRDSAVADRAAEQPRDAGQLWLGASIGLLMIVLIVGGIVGGVATPTEVAAFAVVYALVVGGLAFRELTVKGTVDWLVRSASMAGTILFIVAAAQALTYTRTVERVPPDIADWMTDLAGSGTWLFILVSVVILVVMGSILEGAPALIIFGPLLLPVAIELGIDPLHYGIVLVLSMGLGLFSPPVGLGAFTVCAVGRVPMERMIRPAGKYLAVVAIVLLLVAFWPALTTTLPDALGLSGLERDSHVVLDSRRTRLSSTAMDLTGKTALVTGGGVGIGRGIAVALAGRGADVAFTTLTHAADDVVEAVRGAGRKAVAIKLDATSSQDVDAAVTRVVDELGGLDILVNNAGSLLARVPIAEMSDDHWHRVIEVNLTSAFYCSRAAARQMTHGWGRIINISSLAARNGGGEGRLCRGQSRGQHVDHRPRQGTRTPRHHRQRHRPRFHRRDTIPCNLHRSRGARRHGRRATCETRRDAGRRRGRRGLARLGSRRLHHRRGTRYQRRPMVCMRPPTRASTPRRLSPPFTPGARR